MAVRTDLDDLRHREGVPMQGLEKSQEEAVRITRKHFPYFEYCIVRDWIWIDLDVTSAQEAELIRTQRKPAIILARTVEFDISRRFDVGDFVRTSPLHRFEEGFIFATLNSCYLLMGDGMRKRATLETVASLV